MIGVDGTHADFLWPLSMVRHRPTPTSSDDAAEQMDDVQSMGATGSKSKRTGKAASGASAAASAAAAASSSSAVATPASSDSGFGVNDELLRQIHAFTANDGGASSSTGVHSSGSKLAGALSLGLCYLNRVHSAAASNPSGVKLRSRLLVCSVTEDRPEQYVSMMNAIFSTQKQQVPVDSCVLGAGDSLFLQQASALTGGIYSRVSPKDQSNLLQVLMFLYLPDPTSRHHLILPTQSHTDFRATCFCHQQVVNLAVICPVCLAIFCKSQPKCAVCGTRFAVLAQTQPGARAQTPQLQAPAAAATTAAASSSSAAAAGVAR